MNINDLFALYVRVKWDNIIIFWKQLTLTTTKSNSSKNKGKLEFLNLLNGVADVIA
jgi:hypothetical protein